MHERIGRMDTQQSALYERIQAFSLDQDGAKLTFTRRLARDNGWSMDYARRIVEEYKKFAFLAVTAGHPVTPSDQVDQVWHLHLSYTRSYWQDFCPNVLQTPLHHEPTQGGTAEQTKFDQWYNKTLDSYRQFFGEAPVEIWPDASDRFGRDLHFLRVNTQQNWVIAKLSWRMVQQNVAHLTQIIQRNNPVKQFPILAVSFLLALAIAGCQLNSSIPDPLTFTAAQFLLFYPALTFVAILMAVLLRQALRLPSGKASQFYEKLDPYETAYLLNGAPHTVWTVIVQLMQRGVVTLQLLKRDFAIEGTPGRLANPLEQVALDAIADNGQPHRVFRKVGKATGPIRARLQQMNLLVSPGQAIQAQVFPALIIFAVLGLGLVRVNLGIARGRPVGYLMAMCIVVAVIGISFCLFPVHRSRLGDRVLQQLKSQFPKGTTFASDDPELPLAFALLGSSILPPDTFSHLIPIIAPSNSGGGGDLGWSGSDGGGGDGGGGCGGGGCGGGGCGGGGG